ncbi:carbohydrate ABC transporter permease [Cellulosilyticum sp. I15G10I2]|uniref:carbohydrate ABC transporter permease n=1 Tax=Cellulosilyticum sp. I15G10I2 TaxID=1892843 RepID=UPI00085C3FDD|nr:sugar ABC transporter permease [Cellulosilyticum sp. I15G10I2]
MKERRFYPMYFIWPALIIYGLLCILPGIIGIYYSFTDWSSYSDQINFIGLENYKYIFTSNQAYTKYIFNTLMFTVVSNIVKIIPALFLALMLKEGLRGQNFYRGVLYFPSVLPYLVIGLLFRSMLHPTTGVVNQTLRLLSMDFMAQQWLTDPKWVWGSIFAVDAWRGIGYVMTIFIAGLQAIPESYYEAAKIDGAGYFALLRHITLPMLVPAITINVVFGLTYGLKVFDIIYVLTNGGPGRMTEVVATGIFKEFSDGTYGVGSALSSILFVFMAVIGILIVGKMNEKRVEM